MTYEQIIEALHARKCTSTATALDYAAREEGCALIDGGTSWGNYKNVQHQRLRIPGERAYKAARDLYAEDITDLLNSPVQPDPHRVLSHRRFSVAWAVAEVLRTNDDITKGGTKKV